MANFKNRLIRAFPIFSGLLKRSKSFVNQTIIAGGAAGDHTVTDILKGDQLVGVTYVNFALTEGAPNTKLYTVADLKSECTIVDGKINNTGGTDTSGGFVIVTWMAWE